MSSCSSLQCTGASTPARASASAQHSNDPPLPFKTLSLSRPSSFQDYTDQSPQHCTGPPCLTLQGLNHPTQQLLCHHTTALEHSSPTHHSPKKCEGSREGQGRQRWSTTLRQGGLHAGTRKKQYVVPRRPPQVAHLLASVLRAFILAVAAKQVLVIRHGVLHDCAHARTYTRMQAWTAITHAHACTHAAMDCNHAHICTHAGMGCTYTHSHGLQSCAHMHARSDTRTQAWTVLAHAHTWAHTR